MIFIPLCGYPMSGKSTFLRQFVACAPGGSVYMDEQGRVEVWTAFWGGNKVAVLAPARKLPTLTLIRLAQKYKMDFPHAALLFEWDFTIKEYERVRRLYPKDKWLLAALTTPPQTCVNRAALHNAQAVKPKDMGDFTDFNKAVRDLNKELSEARLSLELPLCELVHGVPPEACAAKLRRYIETAIKLQNETIH